MILKDYIHRPDADSRSEETCAETATRLRNAFKSNEDVLLLNDVRLPFDEDRTINVDHIVLHSYGITLVSSRAIYGKIEVNYRGEWSRNVKGREIAMQNPIDLYKYVSKNLRDNLTANVGELLTRVKGNQRTFENMPIDVLFIQALKSSIIGTGINQSNIIFVEALTQNINRTFVAYKKREFQMYGGLDTFKISQSDMYATANFIMGNEIDRASYPDAEEHAAGQMIVPASVGRPGIIRAYSTLPVQIIKGRDIKPSKKALELKQKKLEEQKKLEAKKQQLIRQKKLEKQKYEKQKLEEQKLEEQKLAEQKLQEELVEEELTELPEIDELPEITMVDEELVEEGLVEELTELTEIDEQPEVVMADDDADMEALLNEVEEEQS